jgi:hypothetical protein
MFNFRNLFKHEASIMDKADYYCDKMKKEPYEEPEQAYYTLGPTTKGRVMLKLGYSNITMDEVGIDNMIKTLEASKAWLEPEKEIGKQPENGCQTEE